MNVTPKRGARRSRSPAAVTPEKSFFHGLDRTPRSKPEGGAPANIMGWDCDTAEMPEEGILRDFDMNMKFGPCCTIPRRTRWERAMELGLNPPESVPKLVERTKTAESVLDVHMRHVSTCSFR
jgi:DNA polymerase delta subunit 4